MKYPHQYPEIVSALRWPSTLQPWGTARELKSMTSCAPEALREDARRRIIRGDVVAELQVTLILG